MSGFNFSSSSSTQSSPSLGSSTSSLLESGSGGGFSFGSSSSFSNKIPSFFSSASAAWSGFGFSSSSAPSSFSFDFAPATSSSTTTFSTTSLCGTAAAAACSASSSSNLFAASVSLSTTSASPLFASATTSLSAASPNLFSTPSTGTTSPPPSYSLFGTPSNAGAKSALLLFGSTPSSGGASSVSMFGTDNGPKDVNQRQVFSTESAALLAKPPDSEKDTQDNKHFTGKRKNGKRVCYCCQQSGDVGETCLKLTRVPDWYKEAKFKSQTPRQYKTKNSGSIAFNNTVDSTFDENDNPNISAWSINLANTLLQEVIKLIKGKGTCERYSAPTIASNFAHSPSAKTSVGTSFTHYPTDMVNLAELMTKKQAAEKAAASGSFPATTAPPPTKETSTLIGEANPTPPPKSKGKKRSKKRKEAEASQQPGSKKAKEARVQVPKNSKHEVISELHKRITDGFGIEASVTNPDFSFEILRHAGLPADINRLGKMSNQDLGAHCYAANLESINAIRLFCQRLNEAQESYTQLRNSFDERVRQREEEVKRTMKDEFEEREKIIKNSHAEELKTTCNCLSIMLNETASELKCTKDKVEKLKAKVEEVEAQRSKDAEDMAGQFVSYQKKLIQECSRHFKDSSLDFDFIESVFPDSGEDMPAATPVATESPVDPNATQTGGTTAAIGGGAQVTANDRPLEIEVAEAVETQANLERQVELVETHQEEAERM